MLQVAKHTMGKNDCCLILAVSHCARSYSTINYYKTLKVHWKGRGKARHEHTMLSNLSNALHQKV